MWGSFLALGLMLGGVYASGFATTGGAIGTANGAGQAFGNPGANEDPAQLAENVSSAGQLRWNWHGSWGSLDSQVMYKIDLDSLPASSDYFSSVMLTERPTGFADLQLQLRLAEVDAGGSCTPAALNGAGAGDSRVMQFGSADAQVTFSGRNGANNGLPGGTTYCVGVADYPGAGSDPGGTFIRKAGAGAGFSGSYPQFVAALEPAASS